MSHPFWIGIKYSRYASSHIQKEVSILAETEVPKVTDENVELQAIQFVYGDYKLARWITLHPNKIK